MFLTYKNALSLPHGVDGVRGLVDAVHLVTCGGQTHQRLRMKNTLTEQLSGHRAKAKEV